MSTQKKRKTRFKTTLSTFGDGMWVFIPVTREIKDSIDFADPRFRRVMCSINGTEAFHCALMPSGSGEYIISVNKKKREDIGIRVGDMIDVTLERDDSRYGLPMPGEFREVLDQDPEGDRLFHALTPGKQRSLLYLAGQKTDIDLRIHWALVIIEHLKENDGKIDGNKLSRELKRPKLDDFFE